MKVKLQRWGNSFVFVMTQQILRDYDLDSEKVYDLELVEVKDKK